MIKKRNEHLAVHVGVDVAKLVADYCGNELQRNVHYQDKCAWKKNKIDICLDLAIQDPTIESSVGTLSFLHHRFKSRSSSRVVTASCNAPAMAMICRDGRSMVTLLNEMIMEYERCDGGWPMNTIVFYETEINLSGGGFVSPCVRYGGTESRREQMCQRIAQRLAQQIRVDSGEQAQNHSLRLASGSIQ